jgi:hypothetical protein
MGLRDDEFFQGIADLFYSAELQLQPLLHQRMFMIFCRKKSLADLKQDYHHLYFLVQCSCSSNLSRCNNNDKHNNFHDDDDFVTFFAC